MSLANDYRPKTWEDVTEQQVVVDILKSIFSKDEIKNRNFLFIGSAGCGKALPMDSNILTTNGYVSMRDITVGTEVFTGKGNRAIVTGVFPQGVRPIYEIELQDRTKIRVSDDHLNVVYRYNRNRKSREDFCVTTKELIKLFETSRDRIRIDIPSVDWEYQEVPIDPYLLGALLGDGILCHSAGSIGFSNTEQDVIDKVNAILERDWNAHFVRISTSNKDYHLKFLNRDFGHIYIYKGERYYKYETISKALQDDGYPKFTNNTLYRIVSGEASVILRTYPELRDKLEILEPPKTLSDVLEELNLRCLSYDKHIPKEYLYNSREVRLKLLQGLIDTDGYISSGGAVEYCTCSDQLSEDFAFLVRSLGIRDTVANEPSRYKKNDEWIYTGHTAHDHHLKIDNSVEFCTSKKQLSRRTDRQQPPMRNIVSIKYVGDFECQCLYVNHDDHTFIADGFIPTHNTTIARLCANYANDDPTAPIIELDAASHSGVEDIRELVQQARTYPIGYKWRAIVMDEVHSLSSQSWQALLLTLEEQPAKTLFFLCTTNPEKIPATIISRVQTFRLSKISLDGITNRLKYVLEQEQKKDNSIKYDEEAVRHIAKLANGGMRDALTLLDKALAYSKEVTFDNISKSLELPNYDMYFDLLNAYAKKDNDTVIDIVDKVYNSGVNFVKWFEGFHSFTMNIVKYISLQDISRTTIPSVYESKMMHYTAKDHSVACIKLSTRLVLMLKELKDTQYLQEVALTYLCHLKK